MSGMNAYNERQIQEADARALRVLAMLEAPGMTQAQLARDLGVTPVFVNRYVKRGRAIRAREAPPPCA
jgi:DNA-binding transcriptional regulator LsrR (DeoR family)